mmetsp:Transcript_29622/g.47497  ORF Transcript_29622/g.47497 Transcript_29622/m.47497 type:complete len:110 (-) Transcript_29622:712-1041(-)
MVDVLHHHVSPPQRLNHRTEYLLKINPGWETEYPAAAAAAAEPLRPLHLHAGPGSLLVVEEEESSPSSLPLVEVVLSSLPALLPNWYKYGLLSVAAAPPERDGTKMVPG